MKFKELIFLLFGLAVPFSRAIAQNNSPSCVNPAFIHFPNEIVDENETTNEIYYQPEDEFTYWYKININADGKIYFDLTPINENDMYDVLTYNYQGENLCNDIIQQSIKPILYKNKGELIVKKGETYYFSILHLNGEGCGHILTLKSQYKEVYIKAIHHNCIEQMMDAIVTKEAKIEIPKTPIPKPSISQELVQPKIEVREKEFGINGVVVNKNTQKQIETELEVLDLSSGNNYKIISGIDTGFLLIGSPQHNYVLSINKLGYELLSDTITILGNTTKIKLELTPIKVGEKIIMHKIYFYPNTYALKEESTIELLKLNKFMLENNQYLFEIQGHTNGNKPVKKSTKLVRSGEEWNFSGTAKKLSKFRADKIKDYLVQNGVKETQIQTIGYGGDKMIIEKPKNMKEAMQNIRVEIIILKKDN